MKYKELFDKITPPKTDDELLREVISRKNDAVIMSKASPKKRPSRAVMIAAAAAVTASVGITTVGASNGWDFTRLFEGFYSDVLNDYPWYVDTGIDRQVLTADLSEMGVDLDKTVDFGYGTVTFKGAVADSNVVMLMFDLCVSDDTLREYYSKHSADGKEPWLNLSLDISKPNSIITEDYGYPLSIPSGTVGENRTGCSRTNISYYPDGFLNKDRVLNITFDTFSMYSGNNSFWELELDEPVTLSLPLDFMNTDRIEVSPNADIIHDNYRYFLEDVVITPLSIQWYTRPGERIEHLPMHSDPLIYRFKDGTEVRNYGISESAEYLGDREFHSALLDKPINVDDLVSVTIGDYTINLDNLS